MKRTWTPAQLELLKVNYPIQNRAALQELFPDKTIAAIKTKATFLGLKKAKVRFRFTPEQIEELKLRYADAQSEELATEFGCSLSSVYQTAQRLGLKKSIECIRETARRLSMKPNHGGNKTRFSKGHTPQNKGCKQTEYMTVEAIEATKATRFSKGNIPANHKPVGYERLNVDGYVEIKVAEPNKFQLKHRVVWEAHNGDIPKSYNVQFMDGNRQNCSIDNLYLVSRKQQVIKNSGSMNMIDNVVAVWIAGRHKKDKDLVRDIKQNPELLELKRKQITLKREIQCKQQQNN